MRADSLERDIVICKESVPLANCAELEAGLISKRTKEALAAAKARGRKLGGNRGTTLSVSARKAGNFTNARHADQRVADIGPTITELRERGITTLRAIATELNARNIPTATGGEWSATQVNRVLARL